MQSFSIGQKVVCISTDWPNREVPMLEKGAVYTCDGVPKHIPSSIYIKEITTLRACGTRYSYGSNRFAPIQSSYTDMTKEIAEGMEIKEERVDKIVVPEKVLN